jgi:hypothetical protein
VGSVTTPAEPRDTFSLRFKNPRNREALRKMAELTGLPQTDIAERAIEHEVVLLAADLERRLEEALHVVRGYLPERDLDTYLDAIEQGEGLDDARGLRGAAAHASAAAPPAGGSRPPAGRSPDALGVLAAFSRG